MTLHPYDQMLANEWEHRCAEEEIVAGYVLTDGGTILVQLPADNDWGFVLADDEQSWPGGFGIATEWALLTNDDPRITNAIRDALGWLLDEARDQALADETAQERRWRVE